jgi:hypothetical protein
MYRYCYRSNSELAFAVPVVLFSHASNVDFETPSHDRVVCNSHILASPWHHGAKI